MGTTLATGHLPAILGRAAPPLQEMAPMTAALLLFLAGAAGLALVLYAVMALNEALRRRQPAGQP
jgi:uncharacterized protein involved in exopolysaccharide biosynthesis